MKKKPNLPALLIFLLVTVAFAWAGVQAGFNIGQHALANGNEDFAKVMVIIGAFSIVGLLIALLAGRLKRG